MLSLGTNMLPLLASLLLMARGLALLATAFTMWIRHTNRRKSRKMAQINMQFVVEAVNKAYDQRVATIFEKFAEAVHDAVVIESDAYLETPEYQKAAKDMNEAMHVAVTARGRMLDEQRSLIKEGMRRMREEGQPNAVAGA